MESGVIKSYIWTFVNRFLHYFLILTLALSYFSADINALFAVHTVCGVLFGAGVILRVLWGFVGTKHSRFRDFQYRGILEYLASILGEKKHYIGHNPASSVAIILIFVLGFLVVLSGLLQYGAEQNGGILKLHYDSLPQDIYTQCNLSKKAFKRALSALIKANKVSLKPQDSIILN